MVDVYIPHRKYQVKPQLSPLFSAACAAAIIHRNHFFRLHQQNKSSDLKVKFRQASNRCKIVLEAAKLAYATKTREYITSQKRGSRDFGGIADSVFNKSKFAIPPLFNDPEVVSTSKNCLLKGPFLVLHFTYYTFIMTLLISVILLSMLMILLSTLNVIWHLISGKK